MLQIVLLVKQSTLAALAEHSTEEAASAVLINDREALVLLPADTVRALLDRARPEDTRIDDVIMRLAL